MKSAKQPILKDLVLIGGGHSHVAVIKGFGMNPLPGVRLTVISRDIHTPYSGMLPGYVAGHYSHDEVHIDLRPLSQFAGARLYHTEATLIDTENKRVICEGRPPVRYDVLSINVGSTPRMSDIAGAEEHAVAVKPISRFVDRWNRLLQRVIAHPGSHRIAVVGAGAAGVELVLAIQYRLQKELAALGRSSEELVFHLVSKSSQIMPQFPAAVAKRFDRILDERGVIVHRGLEATRADEGELRLSDGTGLELDETLFVTPAGAAPWLKTSGFSVDENGFVKVQDTLQVLGHADIFAAGDVAAVENHPRPKAGVFAVRQGKPLADNLRRVLQQKEPRPFSPQKSILALISSGDKYAVATKGPFTWAGAALWNWKDWIDRQFMGLYSSLPEMQQEPDPVVIEGLTTPDTLKEISAIAMRCGGCGAKVGAGVLTRALSALQPKQRNDILIGLHDPDDAAVVEVPANKLMVHTVDYFRAFIDDPYLFGKIAANHSLSDLFAMGATAQSALAIATVPYGIESQIEETLTQMMTGALEVLDDANAALVGGHTSEGAELALGFSVNGLIDRDRILRKGGMQPGNVLVLTKALGTGTLFAADMQQKSKGRWIDEALLSMTQSNRQAAQCLFRHGATACTDVTGFGLLGHLVEMIRPSAVDVELDMTALPVLDGARETVRMGLLSSLQPANVRLRRAIRNQQSAVTHDLYPLMFDPQTSGGLLASIPKDAAQACLDELVDLGYGASRVIGKVSEKTDHPEPVSLIG